MSDNPFKRGEADPSRIIPPKDPAERQRFWIEHGNQSLREKGMGHLQWLGKDGSYWIEPR